MTDAKFKAIGITVPEILLPSAKIDLHKWAVVACDQYTSDKSYWEAVDAYVGSSPSALRVIFPEAYLEDGDADKRIENINKTMAEYLDSGVLENIGQCFIYIERQLTGGLTRKGLILAVDLEFYDYSKGSGSLIRATEETVTERIPPRMKIRKDAVIELPHIMILIDDPDKSVIEPLADHLASQKPLYEFDLMMGGGRIKGYKIDRPELLGKLAEALGALADPKVFHEKYKLPPQAAPLLFAVGDGNHSLASAKAHWEQIKKNLSPAQQEKHPARYALVELVNVHDEGLVFEPIHRLLFNVNPDILLIEMQKYFSEKGSAIKITYFNSLEEAEKQGELIRKKNPDNSCCFVFAAGGRFGLIEILNPPHLLEVGVLQDFLDTSAIASRGKIDYIHERETVLKLSAEQGNMGFLLPVMHKNMLFKTIISEGVLPRKTFSMGEARDKRYYLECRKIR